MHIQSGLTLMELLVVMAISALLLGMGIPSFVSSVRSTNMAASVNTFLSDMRYARSIAMRRGASVVMCRVNRLDDDNNPVCNTGSTLDVDGDGLDDGWAGGWFVFEDVNGDSALSPGETVLRFQSRNTSIGSIMGSSTTNRFNFTATGRLRNLSSATTLTFGGPAYSNTQQRVVCVSMSGHARLAGDGTSSCS
jgi:type IV fimbrial biogenesis protein FimT